METKNEKDLRELEFYELRKKAKDNKPMTQDELKKLNSYKTRDIVNQVLRIFGLAAALFVFVLTFDIFSEGTIWGVFSGRCMHYWKTLIDADCLRILWEIFRNDTGIAVFGCIIMTIIHLAICIGIAYLLAFSIRDIYGFFKKIFMSPIKLVKGVGETAKDSVTPELSETTKSLFEKKTEEKAAVRGRRKEATKTAEVIKPSKTVEAKKTETKVESKTEVKKEEPKEEGFTSEELDRMLKGETLEEIRGKKGKVEEKHEEAKTDVPEVKEEVIEEAVETVPEVEEPKSLGLDDKVVEPEVFEPEKRKEAQLSEFEKNLQRLQGKK